MNVPTITGALRLAVAAVAVACLIAPSPMSAAPRVGSAPVITHATAFWRTVEDEEGPMWGLCLDLRGTDADSPLVNKWILVLDATGVRKQEVDWKDTTPEWPTFPPGRANLSIPKSHTESLANVTGGVIKMEITDLDGNKSGVVEFGVPPLPSASAPTITSVDANGGKIIIAGVGFSSKSRVIVSGKRVPRDLVSGGADGSTLAISGEIEDFARGAQRVRIQVTNGSRRSNNYILIR